MSEEVRKSILDLEEKTSPQVTDYALIMDSAGKKSTLQKIFNLFRSLFMVSDYTSASTVAGTDKVLIQSDNDVKSATVDAVKTAILANINKSIFPITPGEPWSIGTAKTIPEINNYKIYAVTFSGEGTVAVCGRNGTFIRGGGTFCGNGFQNTLSVDFNLNGTTLTLNRAHKMTHTPSSNHSIITDLTVSGIVGII